MSLLRKILLLINSAGGGRVIKPPAWAYFDMIGKIDLREQGGYYYRISGTGNVMNPLNTGAPGYEGAYFNR